MNGHNCDISAGLTPLKYRMRFWRILSPYLVMLFREDWNWTRLAADVMRRLKIWWIGVSLGILVTMVASGSRTKLALQGHDS